MNNIIHRITLDMSCSHSQDVIYIKKSNNAVQVHINLVENGVPYMLTNDVSAKLRAKKPDGNVLFNECEIDGNTIIYQLTTQTSAVVGTVECELTIYGENSMMLSSPNFSMVVLENTVSNDEIESEDEFTALDKAMLKANNKMYTFSFAELGNTVIQNTQREVLFHSIYQLSENGVPILSHHIRLITAMVDIDSKTVSPLLDLPIKYIIKNSVDTSVIGNLNQFSPYVLGNGLDGYMSIDTMCSLLSTYLENYKISVETFHQTQYGMLGVDIEIKYSFANEAILSAFANEYGYMIQAITHLCLLYEPYEEVKCDYIGG